MGLFDFLRSLFGGGPSSSKNASFEETTINSGGPPPSSIENRDLNFSVEDVSAPVMDPQANFVVDTNTVPNSGPAGTVHPPEDAPPVVTPRPNRDSGGSSSSRRNRPLDGLNVDKFAPLTAGEALAATEQAGWQSAYYDSLRVIPPEDLPRIQVIDRTMVGYGLISPEELAEIHEIGRRMDAYRDPEQLIYQAGRRAVERSRSEREQRKQQKRAEAAAKRERRRLEIAHRRANDIDFLGRGVSKGLADRRSNIERVEANNLPLLATPADVAAAMGLSISKLRWLAYHNEAPERTHYVAFQVPKKSGGVRQLATPHRELAAAQRWILDNVLARLSPHDAAHGFVPERSTVTNAAPHVGASLLVNLDLQDFFPTITFYRVEGLLRSFGYSPAAATILALLCTECPRCEVEMHGRRYFPATGVRQLPQGACTSPAISNLIANRLDRRLTGLATKSNWKYTRYADDLTFSSTSAECESGVGRLISAVDHIVTEEGFAINERKTRVLRDNSRQSVTGIVVNDKASVPRWRIRQLRAILHNAKRTGLAAQNRESHPHFESWVRGMIAYIQMVNPDQGAKLKSAYEELLP